MISTFNTISRNKKLRLLRTFLFRNKSVIVKGVTQILILAALPFASLYYKLHVLIGLLILANADLQLNWS